MIRKHMGKIVAVTALGTSLLASSAHAADYADIGAAVTAVTDLPDTISPVFLAFVTLAVGVLTIRLVVRMAKKGLSVA